VDKRKFEFVMKNDFGRDVNVACSVHGSAPRSRNGVRLSGLPRTEAGTAKRPAAESSAERVVPLSVKMLIFYH